MAARSPAGAASAAQAALLVVALVAVVTSVNGQSLTMTLSNSGQWRVFAPQTITITSTEYQTATNANTYYQIQLYRGNLFLATLFEYKGSMFDISGATPNNKWQLGPWSTKLLDGTKENNDVPPTQPLNIDSTKPFLGRTVFAATYGSQYADYLPPMIILPDNTRHTLAGPYVVRLNVFANMKGINNAATNGNAVTKDLLFTVEANIFVYAPWAVGASLLTPSATFSAFDSTPSTIAIASSGQTCYTASSLQGFGTTAAKVPLALNTIAVKLAYGTVPYTTVDMQGAATGMTTAIYPVITGGNTENIQQASPSVTISNACQRVRAHWRTADGATVIKYPIAATDGSWINTVGSTTNSKSYRLNGDGNDGDTNIDPASLPGAVTAESVINIPVPTVDDLRAVTALSDGNANNVGTVVLGKFRAYESRNSGTSFGYLTSFDGQTAGTTQITYANVTLRIECTIDVSTNLPAASGSAAELWTGASFPTSAANTAKLGAAYVLANATAVSLTGISFGSKPASKPTYIATDIPVCIAAKYIAKCAARSTYPVSWNATLADGSAVGTSGADKAMWGDLTGSTARNYSSIGNGATNSFLTASKCGVPTATHGSTTNTLTFTWSLAGCAADAVNRNPTYYRLALYYLGPIDSMIGSTGIKRTYDDLNGGAPADYQVSTGVLLSGTATSVRKEIAIAPAGSQAENNLGGSTTVNNVVIQNTDISTNFWTVPASGTVSYTFAIPWGTVNSVNVGNNAMRGGTSTVNEASDAATSTDTATSSANGYVDKSNTNERPFPIGWYQAEMQLFTSSTSGGTTTVSGSGTADYATVKSNVVLVTPVSLSIAPTTDTVRSVLGVTALTGATAMTCRFGDSCTITWSGTGARGAAPKYLDIYLYAIGGAANGYVDHAGNYGSTDTSNNKGGGQYLIARNVLNPEYNGATSGSYTWTVGCRIRDAESTDRYLVPKGDVQVQIGIFATGDSTFTGYSGCFKLVRSHCCRDFHFTLGAQTINDVYNPLGTTSAPRNKMVGTITDGSPSNYWPNTFCQWWVTPQITGTDAFTTAGSATAALTRPLTNPAINSDETRAVNVSSYDLAAAPGRLHLTPTATMGNLRASRVKLVFKKFQMPGMSGGITESVTAADSDRLTIYDGVDNLAPKLFEWFCAKGTSCTRTNPDSRGIVSTGPYVYIEFQSNADSTTADGFEIEYQAISSADVMTALDFSPSGIQATASAWMPSGAALFTFNRNAKYDLWVRIPWTTNPVDYQPLNPPPGSTTNFGMTGMRRAVQSGTMPSVPSTHVPTATYINTAQNTLYIVYTSAALISGSDTSARSSSSRLYKLAIVPGGSQLDGATAPYELSAPTGTTFTVASTATAPNTFACDLRGSGAYSLVVDSTETFAFIGMNGAIAKVRLADMFYLESIALPNVFFPGVTQPTNFHRWTAGVAGLAGTPSASYVYFFSSVHDVEYNSKWFEGIQSQEGAAIAIDVATLTVQNHPVRFSSSAVASADIGGATIATINTRTFQSGEVTSAGTYAPGTLVFVGTHKGYVLRFNISGPTIKRLGSTSYSTSPVMQLQLNPSHDFLYVAISGSALFRVRCRDFLVVRTLGLPAGLKLRNNADVDYTTDAFTPSSVNMCPTGDLMAVASISDTTSTTTSAGVVQVLLMNSFASDGSSLYLDLSGKFPQQMEFAPSATAFTATVNGLTVYGQQFTTTNLAETITNGYFWLAPQPGFNLVDRTAWTEQVVNKLYWGSAVGLMRGFGDSASAYQSYERTYTAENAFSSFGSYDSSSVPSWAQDNLNSSATSALLQTRYTTSYDSRIVTQNYPRVRGGFIVVSKPLIDGNNALQGVSVGSVVKGCPLTVTFNTPGMVADAQTYISNGQAVYPPANAWMNTYDVIGFVGASLATNDVGTGIGRNTTLLPQVIFATAAPATAGATAGTSVINAQVPAGLPVRPGQTYSVLVRHTADSAVFGAATGVTIVPSAVSSVLVAIQYTDPAPGIQVSLPSSITWNCACGTRVAIQLWQDTTYISSIASNYACTNGANSYTWTPGPGANTYAAGTRYTVRILAVGGDDTAASRSNPFLIGMPSDIPANQSVSFGGVMTIAWTPSKDTASQNRVNIFYVATQAVVTSATEFTGTIKQSAPDTGSFLWRVDDRTSCTTSLATSTCLADKYFQIVVQAQVTDVILYTSPVYYMMPSVGLGPIFPSRGSILTQGGSYSFQWTFSGGFDIETTLISVDLCAGPFNTWTTSAQSSGTPAINSNTYSGSLDTMAATACIPLAVNVPAIVSATPTPTPVGPTATPAPVGPTPTPSSSTQNTTTAAATPTPTPASSTTTTTTTVTATPSPTPKPANSTRRLLGTVNPPQVTNPNVTCDGATGLGPCYGPGAALIQIPSFVPPGVYYTRFRIVTVKATANANAATSKSTRPTQFVSFAGAQSELFSVVAPVTTQVAPTSLVFGMTLNKDFTKWSSDDRTNAIVAMAQDLSSRGPVSPSRIKIVSEQPGSVVLQIEVTDTRENGARDLNDIANDVRSRATSDWSATNKVAPVLSVNVVSDAPSKTPMLDRNGVIILACLGIPLMTFCGCVCGWFAKGWWAKRKSSKAKDVEAYGGYERVPLQQPAPQPVYSSGASAPVYSGGDVAAGAN